jgi:hypothetical protein
LLQLCILLAEPEHFINYILLMEQNLLANLHIQLHESAEIEEDLDDHQDRIKVGNTRSSFLANIP